MHGDARIGYRETGRIVLFSRKSFAPTPFSFPPADATTTLFF